MTVESIDLFLDEDEGILYAFIPSAEVYSVNPDQSPAYDIKALFHYDDGISYSFPSSEVKITSNGNWEQLPGAYNTFYLAVDTSFLQQELMTHNTTTDRVGITQYYTSSDGWIFNPVVSPFVNSQFEEHSFLDWEYSGWNFGSNSSGGVTWDYIAKYPLYWSSEDFDPNKLSEFVDSEPGEENGIFKNFWAGHMYRPTDKSIDPEIIELPVPLFVHERRMFEITESPVDLLDQSGRVVAQLVAQNDTFNLSEITLEESEQYTLKFDENDLKTANNQSVNFDFNFTTSEYGVSWSGNTALKISSDDYEQAEKQNGFAVFSGVISAVENVTNRALDVTARTIPDFVDFEISDNSWTIKIPENLDIYNDRPSGTIFGTDWSFNLELQADGQSYDFFFELFENEPPFFISDYHWFNLPFNGTIFETIDFNNNSNFASIFSDSHNAQIELNRVFLGTFYDPNNRYTGDDISIEKVELNGITLNASDYEADNLDNAKTKFLVEFTSPNSYSLNADKIENILTAVLSDGTNTRSVDYDLKVAMSRVIEEENLTFTGTDFSDVLFLKGDYSSYDTGSGYDQSLVQAVGAQIHIGMGHDDVFLLPTSQWDNRFVAENVDNPVSLISGTRERVSIEGKNRFEVSVLDDTNTNYEQIFLTDNDDALFLHDVFSASFNNSSEQARLKGIEKFSLGGGDDILDLTSDEFLYKAHLNEFFGDYEVEVFGGSGNDILWGGAGNDYLNGGESLSLSSNFAFSPETFSHIGLISGEDDNDILFGGGGSNLLVGGSGADEFQFTNTSVNDTVADFSISDGDTLKFFNTSGAQFDRDSIALNSVGDELTIAYGNSADDTLTIALTNAGLQLDDLTADVLLIM